MQYIVRNLLDSGAESVGTRPLDADAVLESAALRTGRSPAELWRNIAQLDGQLVRSVRIPACEVPGTNYNAVRIEAVLDAPLDMSDDQAIALIRLLNLYVDLPDSDDDAGKITLRELADDLVTSLPARRLSDVELSRRLR